MPLAIAKLLASYFNCMKVTEMRLTPWLQLVLLRKQSQNFCPKFPFCTCFSFFSLPLDSLLQGQTSTFRIPEMCFQLSHAHGLNIHLPDSRRLFLYQGFYPLWYNLFKKVLKISVVQGRHEQSGRLCTALRQVGPIWPDYQCEWPAMRTVLCSVFISGGWQLWKGIPHYWREAWRIVIIIKGQSGG